MTERMDPDGDRIEADAAARAVNETRAFLAARPVPDVTDRVMRRLDPRAHTAPPRPRRLRDRVLQSLWAPRQVSIRPAYALVAAAACIALLVIAGPDVRRTLALVPPSVTGVADARLFVQFRLQAEASNVRLAGSFTNWEPAYELNQMAPGVWTITVPLSQGVHDYAFVVDGQQWIPDPYAPRIDDGFGGTNSRLTLLVPDTPRI
jgi:hypothetical protein